MIDPDYLIWIMPAEGRMIKFINSNIKKSSDRLSVLVDLCNISHLIKRIFITFFAIIFFIACTNVSDSTLRIITHDSFEINQSVIEQFETDNNVQIEIQKAGDAGEVIVRAILEKGNPSADLLYGIDNTFLGRALDEQLFIAYKSPFLSLVPRNLQIDSSNHVTPVSYGFVMINYDKEYLNDHQLTLPLSLEDLTNKEWKGKLVVENPSTSSPGLTFLLATISYFGVDDEYDYLDFWSDLKDNEVVVKDGWTAAYYTEFSKNGGTIPLVVSYSTSPAAEVYFSEGKYTEPPTGNLDLPGASFLQIEGIGILKGTTKEKLAQKFIDYTLQEKFQEDIPLNMWVYPINMKAVLPDVFKYADQPKHQVSLDPKLISKNREKWIDNWSKVILNR
tara:strand:- start:2640 stop:3809 length:1170 start_codon:yes stop_codon:yes gene_type:complete